jgi:hypothetical protein
MTPRAPGYAVFDRQVITHFMEGMDAAINEDSMLLYRQLANIQKMENPNDVLQTFTGGGYYAPVGVWGASPTYEWGTGWKIRLGVQLFKNGFRVPERLEQYSQFVAPHVARHLRMLGAYGIQSLDAQFVQMLNRSFDPAYPTYDGQPIISASHPFKNIPGTFSNLLTAGPISMDSIEEAMVYFSNLRNDDGMYFSMTPQFLVMHPTKYFKAVQVVQNSSPTTALNEGVVSTINNAVVRPGLTLLTSPKLSSTTRWWMVAGKSSTEGLGHGLDIYFSPNGMPRTKTYKLENPDGSLYIGEYESGTLVSKVRGIAGNNGV